MAQRKRHRTRTKGPRFWRSIDPWLARLGNLPGSWWLAMPLGVAVLIAIALGSPVAARHSFKRQAILDAIRWVETRDVANPKDGDGGRAIGPYQIHEIYWRDAVDYDPGIDGGYQDCRRRGYAERVIDAYMRRWIPQAWADGYAEAIARVHNGGPQGADKEATLPYWERVKARLDR